MCSCTPRRRPAACPLVAPLLLLTVAWSACGGGQLAGGTYQDREAAFRIGEPGAGWSRLRVQDANDLAWFHDDLGALIQVNASCDPALDIPLRALTQQLLIGFTERELQAEGLLPMDGREALQTHLLAKLDGVRREMMLRVLKKDGCVYDFSLVAPPGSRFEDARDSYEAVVSAFSARGRAR